MLSRVADNLYWLARYIERSENTARLVNVHANLMLDLPSRYRFGWDSLVTMSGGTQLFEKYYEQSDAASVRSFLLSDERNPGSIVTCLAKARENLRTTRERVPRESWEHLSALHNFAHEKLTSNLHESSRYQVVNEIIAGCQQLTGALAGTMIRDAGYQFIRLGRNLERAEMTSRLIDVRSSQLIHHNDLSPFENVQWMSILKSLSAYHSYHLAVHHRVSGYYVLQFLLLNDVFPRSIRTSLDQATYCLQRLPHHEEALASHSQSIAILKRASLDKLSKDSQYLHEFINALQLQIGITHTVITDTWLTPVRVPEVGPVEA